MSKKIIFFIISTYSTILFAQKGSINVSANINDVFIYIDDIKKAMIGEGYTKINLPEGEYNLVLKKTINEDYEYIASKKIFIGEDTTSNINLILKKVLTLKGKEKIKQMKFLKEEKIINSGNAIRYKGLIYGLIQSPFTKRIWLDRNLGASRVCTYSEDKKCYGDYFQWGRDADGHEKQNSLTTLDISDNTQVLHSKFIISNNHYRNDWLKVKNNKLWNKKYMVNNPCPKNFRVPSINELLAETTDVGIKNSMDAFNMFLKFPVAGYRRSFAGSIGYEGTFGDIWSSNTYKNNAVYLGLSINRVSKEDIYRAFGFSVRCIKNK